MRSVLLLALSALIMPGCETCRTGSAGGRPSPDSCPPPATAPEPRAEGDGPPPARTCAELAGREATVPPLCGPAPRVPCPPPQRVIVEVVHKHEKPLCEKQPCAAAPPPAPPLAMPATVAQPAPVMANPSLVPVQAAQVVAVPSAPGRIGLGFALDFWRLPIPFLRPIPVALPAEAPAVMVLQQPVQGSANFAYPQPAPPPQQYAHVPVSGTALVPVPPGPPLPVPTALPPALAPVCPPCPPCPPTGTGGPAVSPATLDALTREVDALRRAVEGGRR
jgi:hypothetical protein